MVHLKKKLKSSVQIRKHSSLVLIPLSSSRTYVHSRKEQLEDVLTHVPIIRIYVRSIRAQLQLGLSQPQVEEGLAIGERCSSLVASELCLILYAVNRDIAAIGELFVPLAMLYTVPADSCHVFEGIAAVVRVFRLQLFQLVGGAENLNAGSAGKNHVLLFSVGAIAQGVTTLVVAGHEGQEVGAAVALNSPHHAAAHESENIVVSCRAAIVSRNHGHFCKFLIKHLENLFPTVGLSPFVVYIIPQPGADCNTIFSVLHILNNSLMTKNHLYIYNYFFIIVIKS